MILSLFFYYLNKDSQTWCALLKTKKYVRQQEAAERIRLHFHWYVRKFYDMPKGSVYHVETLGDSKFTTTYHPSSKYANFPKFVLVVEEPEDD